jgi:AcrR family transcriptional regulator
MPDTRTRILDTGAELFRRQGYAATGIKQIVTAAQAPFGSIYHHFPGGKEQLGAEAIRVSGSMYELLVPAVFGPAPDVLRRSSAAPGRDRLRGCLPDRDDHA